MVVSFVFSILSEIISIYFNNKIINTSYHSCYMYLILLYMKVCETQAHLRFYSIVLNFVEQVSVITILTV